MGPTVMLRCVSDVFFQKRRSVPAGASGDVNIFKLTSPPYLFNPAEG